MNKHVCNLCGEVMTFSPSLEERSKQTGKPISYYKAIFTTHAECTLKTRHMTLSEVIKKYPKSKYVKQLWKLKIYSEDFKKAGVSLEK